MNTYLWVGLGFFFLAAFFLVLGLLQRRFDGWKKQVELSRFMVLVGIGHTQDELMHQSQHCRWCRWVGILLPMNTKERDKLQLRLLQAGFNHPNAVYGFTLIKLVSTLAGLGIGFLLWQQGQPAFMPLVLAAVGVILPQRILEMRARQLRSWIHMALPDFLDMVSIAMRAGLNWMAAFQRVNEEFRTLEPALAEAFDQMLRQIQVGMPRIRALEQLAERTDLDDVRQLVQMLIENERLGAPIAPSLEAFTQRLYSQREQQLEERAAKLSAKMSIVVLIFMMVPYFIILLGERFVELSRSF